MNSWTPGISLNWTLNSFSTWSAHPLTFFLISGNYSLPWFHCCNQLNHPTYQGPSLRTDQNYKNYDYPLSMRTYLHFGGESVMVCKGRGYNFAFGAMWWEIMLLSHDLWHHFLYLWCHFLHAWVPNPIKTLWVCLLTQSSSNLTLKSISPCTSQVNNCLFRSIFIPFVQTM